MAGPYAPGDQVVYLEHDPAGMRIWKAEVTEVDQLDLDSWQISTTHGTEVVNRVGEGASIVPVDEEIARTLVQQGDGFLVTSTVRDIEQHLDQSIDWPSIERDLGGEGRER
jgi:hypothetical protein